MPGTEALRNLRCHAHTIIIPMVGIPPMSPPLIVYNESELLFAVCVCWLLIYGGYSL